MQWNSAVVTKEGNQNICLPFTPGLRERTETFLDHHAPEITISYSIPENCGHPLQACIVEYFALTRHQEQFFAMNQNFLRKKLDEPPRKCVNSMLHRCK